MEDYNEDTIEFKEEKELKEHKEVNVEEKEEEV